MGFDGSDTSLEIGNYLHQFCIFLFKIFNSPDQSTDNTLIGVAGRRRFTRLRSLSSFRHLKPRFFIIHRLRGLRRNLGSWRGNIIKIPLWETQVCSETVNSLILDIILDFQTLFRRWNFLKKIDSMIYASSLAF